MLAILSCILFQGGLFKHTHFTLDFSLITPLPYEVDIMLFDLMQFNNFMANINICFFINKYKNCFTMLVPLDIKQFSKLVTW